jgi:hypothetical protein
MAFETEVTMAKELETVAHCCQAWVQPSTGKKALEEFRKNTKLFRISHNSGKPLLAYHCRRPVHESSKEGNLCYIHNKSFVKKGSGKPILFKNDETIDIVTDSITLNEREFRKHLTDEEKKIVSGTSLSVGTTDIGDILSKVEQLSDVVEFLKGCFSKIQEENEFIRETLAKIQGIDSPDDSDDEIDAEIIFTKTKINSTSDAEESDDEESDAEEADVEESDVEESDVEEADDEEDGMPSLDAESDGEEIEVELISMKSGKHILVDQISHNVYKSPDNVSEEYEIDMSEVIGNFLEVEYSNSLIEWKGDNYIVGTPYEDYIKCIHSNIAYEYDNFGRLYPVGRIKERKGKMKLYKAKFKV